MSVSCVFNVDAGGYGWLIREHDFRLVKTIIVIVIVAVTANMNLIGERFFWCRCRTVIVSVWECQSKIGGGPPRPMGPGAAHRLHTHSAATK